MNGTVWRGGCVGLSGVVEIGGGVLGEQVDLGDEIDFFVSRARPAKLRSFLEFSESEIVLPDTGRFGGMRFRYRRLPWMRLYHGVIDTGQWNWSMLTGSSQGGKTVGGSSIPVVKELFENREHVVYAVPDGNMVADKWGDDIHPFIEKSQYEGMLPSSGGGSRGGGKPVRVKFENGMVLRFMTAGGGDTSRAGKTTRVMVVTELSGWGESGGTSSEASKFKQLMARLRSFGEDGRGYFEGTVTTSKGLTWKLFESGTGTMAYYRCCACREFVRPEREHLVGWQDAENVRDARLMSAFACPCCGVIWSDDDRLTILQDGVAVHRGQTVDVDGVVHGDVPLVEMFTFRFSGFDNAFLKAGDFGVDEWKGARDPDEEDAERELCQFVWCKPYDGGVEDLTSLELERIIERQPDEGRLVRGVVPEDTEFLVVGKDVGGHKNHWVLLAYRGNETYHVVDYRIADVPAYDLGEKLGLWNALRTFRDEVVVLGWPVGTADGGERFYPDACWVDSGYLADVLYEFCNESDESWLPVKGFGGSQRMAPKYTAPSAKSRKVRFVGVGYHIARLQAQGAWLAHVDSDYWKSSVHNALKVPVGEPGSLTFFRVARDVEHMTFGRHLLSETEEEVFEAGKGTVRRWVHGYKANHYFDALAYGFAAVEYCLACWTSGPAVSPTTSSNFAGSDGRSFLVTER